MHSENYGMTEFIGMRSHRPTNRNKFWRILIVTIGVDPDFQNKCFTLVAYT